MSEQLWTMVDTVNGTVLQAVVTTSPAGQHPKDAGWPWDNTRQKAVKIAARPGVNDKWTGSGWAEDLALVKAQLVTAVKKKNADLVSSLYTTEFGKQKKYSRKQQEVMDFRALAPVTTSLSAALTTALGGLLPAFNQLGAAAQKKKFRYAMKEAALRGVTVDVVIGRFEQRIEIVEEKVSDWEAIEQVAVDAINAATTVAAARAAYLAINWAWTA